MSEPELKSMIHDKHGKITMASLLGCVLGISMIPVVILGFLGRAVVIAFTHGMEQYDKWDDTW